MTLTAVPGIEVGHAVVPGGGSGCTVVVGPFRGSCEIRGLATGTRELDALAPGHLVPRVDAILLTGGSAFGLSAADGVMAWLEERGRGYDTGAARVPIVPGAVIYDLAPDVPRPGPALGREACDDAAPHPVEEGRVGAGAGATVGSIAGPGGSMPGGVGSASAKIGGHRIGAVAVVNAFGDVLDGEGRIVAGARDPDGSFVDTAARLREGGPPGGFGVEETGGGAGRNTTLVVVGTDVALSATDLRRLARMASTALPRRISPVNTLFDGDVVFAISTGGEGDDPAPGELVAAGAVATEVVEEAIERAVSR